MSVLTSGIANVAVVAWVLLVGILVAEITVGGGSDE